MRRWSRLRIPIILVLALVASACAGGAGEEDGPSVTSTAPSATTVPATVPPATAAPGGPAATPSTVDDRPIAPDFTLDLGDGGTFVLSEETRPVYLVFWAEW